MEKYNEDYSSNFTSKGIWFENPNDFSIVKIVHFAFLNNFFRTHLKKEAILEQFQIENILIKGFANSWNAIKNGQSRIFGKYENMMILLNFSKNFSF